MAIVLITLLSVTTGFAGGTEENSEVETTHCYAISQDPINASRYSGDDIYDPAVNDVFEISVNIGKSFSGDDAYDLAAGAEF